MTKKDDYVRKMHAKLDQWDSDIERLTAKADQVKAGVRTEYHKQVQDLRSKSDDAKRKLQEVQGAREDAWEDLKSGLDLAWTALGEAFESAKSRFKPPEEMRR